MPVEVRSVRVGRILMRSRIPGFDYAINHYVGCLHGCLYCYARDYCSGEVADRWGELVIVKRNADEVLRREIARAKGRIALSTLTDPYQPIERKLELTRRILAIAASRLKVSVQTKSPLVLRDVDLLGDNVDVGITITTLDERLAKKFEPSAPKPRERVRTLERLAEEGVKTWVFYGPILGDDIEEVVEVAKATNSTLYFDKLRIKKRVPREVAEVAKRDWKSVFRRITELCERKGVRAKPAFG
ncbi:MAG: radical SAM protein [Archaeoglobaceae archaeon]